MAGGEEPDSVVDERLPDDLPDLAIKCVEEDFNAAYHVRLNGVVLPGFTGRTASFELVKQDLEKSILKMAGRYIHHFSTYPDETPLDNIMSTQLFAALKACRDGGAPMRLDVVVTNTGSNNGHIEYALYSDKDKITPRVTLNTITSTRKGAKKEDSILARTEGVSGHVTYALSLKGPPGGSKWVATELERNSYTPRIVGLWFSNASPV